MVFLLALGAIVASAGGDVMNVELDIFSGRPNPVWSLSERQVGEMDAIIETLPATTASVPTRPGLGYRGFVVTRLPQRAWRLDLFKGFVAIASEGRTEIRSDRERKLERFLLDSAGSELSEAIRRRVEMN
jgi:hypothetical protein